MWKVTYAIDSLDTNPVIKTFEQEYEAIDWLNEEQSHRVDQIVQHSQYLISEKELEEIEENEASLSRIIRA
mgnify:CR=1 FL=1|jgi:hypothetical protein|tara:strand:- start:142 stop:354 length:213 start_codon:yes stop_codon:yes gene_type:complete